MTDLISAGRETLEDIQSIGAVGVSNSDVLFCCKQGALNNEKANTAPENSLQT
jgi:hypothetical protein